VSWVHPRYQTFNACLVPADVGPLTTTARPLDHTALALLPEAAFVAEADSLRRRLPDAVLAQALLAVPAEVRARMSQELLPALRARRDALPAAARRYYQVVQQEAVVTGTDAPERFELVGLAPGFGVHLYGGAGRNVFLQTAIMQPAGTGFTIHPGPADDLVQVSHTVRVLPATPALATAAAWVASQYRLQLGSR
jgi:hypothetical protein